MTSLLDHDAPHCNHDFVVVDVHGQSERRRDDGPGAEVAPRLLVAQARIAVPARTMLATHLQLVGNPLPYIKADLHDCLRLVSNPLAGKKRGQDLELPSPPTCLGRPNIRALKDSSVPTALSSEDWRPRSRRRPEHPPRSGRSSRGTRSPWAPSCPSGSSQSSPSVQFR